MGEASYDTTMTVLFRWIFVASLLRIAAITIAIVAVFMIAESFDKARLIGQSMTLSLLAEYLILKIPFMISEFMPVIVLIASAIYITEISLHHELVAVRAAGVSMRVLLKPLLAAAICAGIFTFAMGEWIEPMTNERRAYMERVYVEGKQPQLHGVQWLRDGGQMMRLMPLKEDLFALMLLETDNKGAWLKRVDSARAYYANGVWHLSNAFVSTPDQGKGIHIEELQEMQLATHISPKTVAPPSPRDMRWLELYGFTQILKSAGLASDDYVFQLHRKIAAPLACLVMVILAYSLCGNMGSRIAANSKGLLIAITIGLAFYVLSSTVVVLVTGGQLPVIYAAWWPNILFAGLAGYLLMKKEGY